MKVLLTGATGFTGSSTLTVLLDRGVSVRCFVRRTSNIANLVKADVEIAYGDLNEPQTLRKALEGVDALVNIASLGFGHAPGIVWAAREAGIQRAVFISTTAIFTQLNAESKKVRLAAEKAIADSGLMYTILRPTMIYGGPRDRNICRLVRYIEKYPVIPVFGDGRHLQQPIYVQDVSAALDGALRSDETCGKAYNIAGANAISFNELIDTVAGKLKKRIRRVHLPAGIILRSMRLFERSGLKLPISSEQVQRLNEDKSFSYSDAAGDFGFAPITFEDGIQREIEAIRSLE